MLLKIVLFCSLTCIFAISLDTVENESTTAVNSGSSSCMNQTIELLLNDDDLKHLKAVIQAKKHAEKKKKTEAHLCLHPHGADCPHKHQHQQHAVTEELELTTKAIVMTLAQLTAEMNKLMTGQNKAHLESAPTPTMPNTEQLPRKLPEDYVPK